MKCSRLKRHFDSSITPYYASNYPPIYTVYEFSKTMRFVSMMNFNFNFRYVVGRLKKTFIASYHIDVILRWCLTTISIMMIFKGPLELSFYNTLKKRFISQAFEGLGVTHPPRMGGSRKLWNLKTAKTCSVSEQDPSIWYREFHFGMSRLSRA